MNRFSGNLIRPGGHRYFVYCRNGVLQKNNCERLSNALLLEGKGYIVVLNGEQISQKGKDCFYSPGFGESQVDSYMPNQQVTMVV